MRTSAWPPATAQTPAVDAAPSSLLDHLRRHAERYPRRTALRRRHFDRWEPLTFEHFHDEIRQVAKGLAASGIQPGDRVAVMSDTRYEWSIAEYAIWYTGAVPVAVCPDASAELLEWILTDCGAVGVFLASRQEHEVFASVADRVPNVTRTWVFDEDCLNGLAESGEIVGDDDLDSRGRTLRPADLATVTYSSGTTGRPKACMTTHRSVLMAVAATAAALPQAFSPDSATLLVLPLAHQAGRLVQWCCIYAGVALGHWGGVQRLGADLLGFQPTFLVTFPQLLEGILDTARRQAHSGGRGRLFEAAASTAQEYGKAIERSGPGTALRARRAVFDRLVLQSLRSGLGGRTGLVLCVGAPLPDRTRHFFNGAGIPVLQSYGLTEATAVCTFNRPDAPDSGSLGSPIPGLQVRVDADGEVLLRGSVLFDGYFNDPSTTAEVLIDGWLHTGDVGRLDECGQLRILGRKVDLIAAPTGRNLAPFDLEDRIRAHPLIANCMVLSAGPGPLLALVTLDLNWLPIWLKGRRRSDLELTPTTMDAVARDPDVLAEVRSAVDLANSNLASAERIGGFVVLAVQWTQADGQLTPSGSLRRSLLCKEHAAEIQARTP